MRFDWAAPTHRSIHPPLCTLQQPEHSSHIWPLSLAQTLPLLPLYVVITHKPCVLLFLFYFMISPLLSCNHKNTKHSNVIDSHDLEGKRNSTVPSRKALFSSAAHVLLARETQRLVYPVWTVISPADSLSHEILVAVLKQPSKERLNEWETGKAGDFQWYRCLMGPSALQQWRFSNCYYTSRLVKSSDLLCVCVGLSHGQMLRPHVVLLCMRWASERTSSHVTPTSTWTWGWAEFKGRLICHLFIHLLIIQWLVTVQSSNFHVGQDCTMAGSRDRGVYDGVN